MAANGRVETVRHAPTISKRHAGAGVPASTMVPVPPRPRIAIGFSTRDVNLAGNAGERDLMMKMRRRGRWSPASMPFRDQLVQACENLRQPVNSVGAGPRCAGSGSTTTDQRRIRADRPARGHGCCPIDGLRRRPPTRSETFSPSPIAPEIKPLGTHIVKTSTVLRCETSRCFS